MKYTVSYAFAGIVSMFLLSACETNSTNPNESKAKIRFEFKFDPNQTRLGNLAQPAPLPEGHAGQNPDFNGMSVHYIEFAPSGLTPLGQGSILYKNAEVASTANGFNSAIDFSKAIISDEGVVFLEVPIKDIPAGTYEWVRASVAYQNYTIKYNLKNIPVGAQSIDLNNQTGTLASFLGYNTHITEFTVKEKTVTVNADKKQGFWAFETKISLPEYGYSAHEVSTGESAATTVVNPLSNTSPIPPGSCVITGAFDNPLTITGSETEDITVVLSFSIQKSFEWKDTNGNGQWDINVGDNTVEQIVDMGLRGLEVRTR